MSDEVVLWTADWHLRSRPHLWASLPAMRGDQEFALAELRKFARERGVTAVVLLGDIFDRTENTSPALAVMREILDDWHRAGIRIFFVQGQHDASQPPLLSALHRDAEHLHGRRVTLAGHMVFGLDYGPADEIRRRLRELPDCHFVATHQVWVETMGPVIGEVALADISRPVSVVSGDLHRTLQTAFRTATGELLSFYSPGALLPQKKNEPWSPTVFLSNVSGDPVPHTLPSRRVWQLTLSNEEDLARFEAQADAEMFDLQPGVPPEIARGLLLLSYSPDIPAAWDRIQNVVADRMHVHRTLIQPAAAEPEMPPESAEAADADLVQSLLLRSAGTGPEKELLQLLWQGDITQESISQFYTRLCREEGSDGAIRDRAQQSME